MTEIISPSLSSIDPFTGQPAAIGEWFVNSPYASGYSPLSGETYIFPFTLLENTRVVFNTMHSNIERQDYTLCSWFSTKPITPVIFYQNRVYEMSLIRSNRSFALQDQNYHGSATSLDSRTSVIYTEPGNYYFQINNRTNYTNKFELSYQIITLT
jgi:hypothetical protein